MIFKIKCCAAIVALYFISDVHSKMDTRIINGVTATRKQFPFYCKLIITELKVQMLLTTKHECGSSLISSKAILTAAHCIYYEKQIIVRAYCGFYEENKVEGVQKLTSRQNIVHEKYDPRTLVNDIGLVLLATEVKLTADVKLVPISCEYTMPYTVLTGRLTSEHLCEKIVLYVS